jgi:Brp/Blh family beta-carotene 15,15'-monooxygenase
MVFVLVGVVGMAHGSIDHIIATDVLKIVPKNRKALFIAVYLLIIALYVLLWYISPLTSFLLFILYSAYHFGEADTSIITQNLNKVQISALSLSYGLLIISAMVFFNPSYTTEICPIWFTKILPPHILVSSATWIFYVSFGGLIFQNIVYSLLGKIPWRKNILFLMQLTFVTLIFVLLPALVAFSIYFGLWHAMLVLKREFYEVNKIRLINTGKEFIWALTPFTLLTLGVMLIIIYFGSATAHFSTIVAISVLAFPHTLLMHVLYSRKLEVKT